MLAIIIEIIYIFVSNRLLMNIKRLVGKRILVKKVSGEYKFSSSESALLLPNGYDLNESYSEGVVEQVSDSSICLVGDRVVYVESLGVEIEGKFIVPDSGLVMIERI